MNDDVPEPDTVPAGTDSPGRDDRWSLAAAIILSLATFASAWCGFQASAWGAVSTVESRAASTHRMEASRHSAIADRHTSTDVLLFTAWVEADISGQTQFADELAKRFLPHFTPAFDAWLAQPAAQGQLPGGSPFDQDVYQPPTQALAEEANRLAGEAIERADEASAIGGRYVLATVLFASVLFLSGIASKLSQPRLARAVVLLAGITLIGALVTMLLLPIRF